MGEGKEEEDVIIKPSPLYFDVSDTLVTGMQIGSTSPRQRN